MTTETVLTEEEILNEWDSAECIFDFARAIEQAVLQSPEVRRRRQALEVAAVGLERICASDRAGECESMAMDALSDIRALTQHGNKLENRAPSPYQDEEAKYEQAKAAVLQNQRASISLVQRTLRIGYNQAAHYLERMAQDGILSPMTSAGNRTIL